MVYCKYSGEQVLGCALGTLVSFGAASADNAIAKSQLNEPCDHITGSSGIKPSAKELQAAQDYNNSPECNKDNERLHERLKNNFDLSDNEIVNYSTEIPSGYGIRAGKVVNPNGDFCDATTIPNGDGSSRVCVSSEVVNEYGRTEFRGVIRHELIHVYHNWKISENSKPYSEEIAYWDTYNYFYDNSHDLEGNVTDARLANRAVEALGSCNYWANKGDPVIPLKNNFLQTNKFKAIGYETDFNEILFRIKNYNK